MIALLLFQRALSVWRQAFTACILALTICGTQAVASARAQGCSSVLLSASGSLECADAEPAGATRVAEGLTFGQGLDIVGQPVLISSARPKRSSASLQLSRAGSSPSTLTLPLNRFSISSQFGQRIHPILGTARLHSGIDMAAPSGTGVYAAADGMVAVSGWGGGYGWNVRLVHPGNLETRYGHLSALYVVAGQRVVAGQLIGRVGSTGLSTGPHLHYELRVNGMPTNPSLLKTGSRR